MKLVNISGRTGDYGVFMVIYEMRPRKGEVKCTSEGVCGCALIKLATQQPGEVFGPPTDSDGSTPSHLHTECT